MQNNMTILGFGRTVLRRHLTPVDVSQTLMLALMESREPGKVRGMVDRLGNAP